jgi:beta-glucanase (GH16 family)
VPPRSTPSGRTHRAIPILAIAVLLAGIVLPASAAGASSDSCDPVRSLLGLCPVAPSAPPPSSSPTPTCGDETPLRADGSAWHCAFDEEFDGAHLDSSKWTVQTTASYGFHSGEECMVDDPDNISVSGGHLNLTVRDVGAEFTCKTPKGGYVTHYTGASVYTAAFAQEYGRFEVRAKFPESSGTAGIQSSLWLFPHQMTVTGLLAAGSTEIDIAESYSKRPDIVNPTVHGISLSSLLLNSYCSVPDWGADFHTYAVEWSPATITFIYDGAACLKVATPPTLPSSMRSPNPFVIALSQALGIGTNRNDQYTPLPATEQIDYVRAWS